MSWLKSMGIRCLIIMSEMLHHKLGHDWLRLFPAESNMTYGDLACLSRSMNQVGFRVFI